MSRLSRIVVLFLFCSATAVQAQSFQFLFPGISGPALLDSLTGRFLPITVLEYGPARDTLYSKVLAIDDDTVRCIYTGHALYLDPTQDPTQYIYLNGSAEGMNAEHAYPQSKGAADGNARSDMHHLFPVRIPANDARADVPFGEIPDAQTQKWFYKNQIITSIPASNKDAWSESKSDLFEPREVAKGDLARAVFYFYTMYRNQANAADPNFFELQRHTLCLWNAQDPADDAELIKTWRIAAYQENKPNPYILDCTLAFRTFCPEVAPNCTVGTQAAALPDLALRIVPNPFTTVAQVTMELPFSGDIQGFIRSSTGQEIARFNQTDVPSGTFHWPLEFEGTGQYSIGFLEIHLTGKDGVRVSRVVPVMKM